MNGTNIKNLASTKIKQATGSSNGASGSTGSNSNGNGKKRRKDLKPIITNSDTQGYESSSPSTMASYVRRSPLRNQHFLVNPHHHPPTFKPLLIPLLTHCNITGQAPHHSITNPHMAKTFNDRPPRVLPMAKVKKMPAMRRTWKTTARAAIILST